VQNPVVYTDEMRVTLASRTKRYTLIGRCHKAEIFKIPQHDAV
jgi:hypothetical protein